VELRNDGKLADIAPTILDILQISQPQEMTGRSLLKAAEYDLQLTRAPVQIGL
jgi:2,3-bisphosphoglycerate-independent phosphoglycerate mutase